MRKGFPESLYRVSQNKLKKNKTQNQQNKNPQTE